MWFKFPKGVTNATFNLQSFGVEAKDADGRGYFRAPDHFAPVILLGPGYEQVEQPPEGAPDDLPRPDPLRDGAIASLTAELEATKREVKTLREDIAAMQAAAQAAINAVKAERDALAAQLKQTQEKAEDDDDDDDVSQLS